MFIGIFKIRNHIIKYGFIGELNNKMIILHAVSFALYLLAGILLYFNYTIYLLKPTKERANRVVIVQIVCIFFEFLFEVTLSIIFVELGK